MIVTLNQKLIGSFLDCSSQRWGQSFYMFCNIKAIRASFWFLIAMIFKMYSKLKKTNKQKWKVVSFQNSNSLKSLFASNIFLMIFHSRELLAWRCENTLTIIVELHSGPLRWLIMVSTIFQHFFFIWIDTTTLFCIIFS